MLTNEMGTKGTKCFIFGLNLTYTTLGLFCGRSVSPFLLLGKMEVIHATFL